MTVFSANSARARCISSCCRAILTVEIGFELLQAGRHRAPPQVQLGTDQFDPLAVVDQLEQVVLREVDQPDARLDQDQRPAIRVTVV